MASSSGIGAAQELKDAFGQARSERNKRFLKAQIVDEVVTLMDSFDGTDSDEADFPEVLNQLEAKQPCFIAFRFDKAALTGEEWMLLAYVPDGSKVRDRMVYASTRFNVKKELGLGNFIGDLYGTEESDFTWPALVEASTKKVNIELQHLEREKVLTDAERQMNVDDREIMRDVDTTGRTHSISFPVDDAALQMLEDLKAGSVQLVQWKVLVKEERIEGVRADACADVPAMVALVDNENPRFYFISFGHTFEGAEMTSIIFLYFCPDGAPVRERMIMSTVKAKVLERAGDIEVAKSCELRELEELTEKYLFEEVHPPPKEEVKMFSRPKMAGKGGRRLIRKKE